MEKCWVRSSGRLVKWRLREEVGHMVLVDLARPPVAREPETGNRRQSTLR